MYIIAIIILTYPYKMTIHTIGMYMCYGIRMMYIL